ncbi:hypothetical protein LXL04_021938 [Taraxacum kok-saghyz]
MATVEEDDEAQAPRTGADYYRIRYSPRVWYKSAPITVHPEPSTSGDILDFRQTELISESDFEQIVSPDGTSSICGFGSLLPDFFTARHSLPGPVTCYLDLPKIAHTLIQFHTTLPVSDSFPVIINCRDPRSHPLLTAGCFVNPPHIPRNSKVAIVTASLTPESLASLPPFTSITFNSIHSNRESNSKPEVAKTGLGSSAAMTTAVVAALLSYLGVVNLSSDSGAHQENLDVVHIIAQMAHCMAQGKVGSGFDVSSAVYGSHRYVRFSPQLISSSQDALRFMPLEEVVGGVLKGKWDHERTKFSLPPLMNLWIEQASDAISLEIVKTLIGARDAMLNIRLHMQEMGKAAGIPIEPESQT